MKRNLVGHIKKCLERANLTVFVDYEMRKGVHSWPHILATLRGARRVLMMLTPDFEESAWCLEEARAAAEQLDAVLPVVIDREASWDEGKMRAAMGAFTANRDFSQLRTEVPELAADILQHWRSALDSAAGNSYFLMHSSKDRCEICSLTVVCITDVLTWSRPSTSEVIVCSFDVNLMDELQTHFLEVFCPLLRPAAEHEVELPSVLYDLALQLLMNKVSQQFPKGGGKAFGGLSMC